MKPKGLKDLADPADRLAVTDAPRPLRRDAERNRQRILTAAVEIINERGLQVRDAGRGPGAPAHADVRHLRPGQVLLRAAAERAAARQAGRPGPSGRTAPAGLRPTDILFIVFSLAETT
jgi:hypothetical protein